MKRMIFQFAVIGIFSLCSIHTVVADYLEDLSQPLEIKATFLNQESRSYYNQWVGLINCYAKNKRNSITLEFRTGTGDTPSNLTSLWASSGKKGESSTQISFAMITASDVSQEMLYNWISMQSNRNPSLSFELIPKIIEDSDDRIPVYQNSTAVEGKVYIIEIIKNQPFIQRYADIVFPAQSLSLNMPSRTLSNTINLTSSSVILKNISKELLRKFLPGIKFSNKAVFESKNFVAKTKIIENRRTFISFASLFKTLLLDLFTAQKISLGAFRQLTESMDNAIKLQQKAEMADAASSIITLEKSIKVFGEKGDIDSNSLELLLLKAKDLKKGIIYSGVSLPTLGSTLTPFTPGRSDFYVDQGFVYPTSNGINQPDGTKDYPFTSIVQALNYAKSIGCESINVFVYSGFYDEPLEITRYTALCAISGCLCLISGTITNNTSSKLEINGFYLVGSDSPGAVQVANSSAKTSISNTVIQDASRFGIYQDGGDLILNNVHIYYTKEADGNQFYGTGIYVKGGAKCSLQLISSSSNGSFAMVIEGNGTFVTASNVMANSNKMNTFYTDDYVANPASSDWVFSGILMKDGASASFSILRMADNQGGSFRVINNATVNISDAIITQTKRYEPAGGWKGEVEYGAGTGIRVNSGGYANMSNFELSYSDLTGFTVGTGGAIDLSYGKITHNTVGGAIFDESFDINRVLGSTVWWVENSVNLQSSSLPVPGW